MHICGPDQARIKDFSDGRGGVRVSGGVITPFNPLNTRLYPNRS